MSEYNPKVYRMLPLPGTSLDTELPDTQFMRTVYEISQKVQVAFEMAMLVFLAAISAASLGRYDVELPTGQIKALALAIIIVAASGERKSSVLDKAFEALRKLEREEREQHTERMASWRAQDRVWSAKHKDLLKQLQKCAEEGDIPFELEEALSNLESERPSKPPQFKTVYEDTTAEALLKGLHQNLPFASLITSEGDNVVSSALFRHLGKMNSLWSGETITVDRATTDSFELSDARLTTLLMIQPEILQAYQERKGEQSRGSGLWSRYLVYKPASLKGTRFASPSTPSSEKQTEIGAARLYELYREHTILMHIPDMDRKVIRFSPQAMAGWFQLYNEIEQETAPGGRFDNAPDHAAKLAENVGRVAALLHLFENRPGDIEMDILRQAIDICCMCSTHFQQIMIPKPQAITDALTLDEWLNRHRRYNALNLQRNDIRRYGPNKLRNARRLNDALAVLHDQGRVQLYFHGRTHMVWLQPDIVTLR